MEKLTDNFFLDESYNELQNLDFKGFETLGLRLDPEHFDFVYGYPPLYALENYRDSNYDFLRTTTKVGLYVHIPFCSKICNFCYFVKKVQRNREYIKTYINALKKEIQLYSKLIGRPEFEYCYFGGGTPTFLNEEELRDIIESIKHHFSFAKNAEFTCEASPETLTEQKIQFLHQIGFTRISVGIQSFDNAITKEMNRAHEVDESLLVIELLNKYFKKTFNIDIIYGYPSSNENILLNDLTMCDELHVPSVTLYQIWLRVSTALSNKSQPPQKKDIFLQKLLIKNFLKEKNYSRDKSDWYIKNEAAKFRFQDHKWQNKFFYGVGTSSYAYVNDVYYRNETNIDNYIKKIQDGKLGISTLLKLDPEKIIRRACSLGIKTEEGINLHYLKSKDVNSYNQIRLVFDSLVNFGLGKYQDDFFKLTELGFLIPDNISELFNKQKKGVNLKNLNYLK